MRICYSGVKFFFKHVLKRDWHLLTIAQARREKRLPAVLSRDEVKKIFSLVRPFHNYAYLATVYSCGLRLQEGLYLEVSDIDGPRKMIHVHRGKGAKDRYVPLPESTYDLLRRYWRTHRNPILIFPAVGRGGQEGTTSKIPMSIEGVQGAITEIFRTFGPEYLARYPDMPLPHKKTVEAIINRRSGHYGVSVYRCEKCGKNHDIDRSCGNRHCPQCQYHKSHQWLEAQLNRRLPGDHFLLTFTVPEQVRPFCRSHQEAAYGAMFDASANAMAKDPRFIGTNLPGFTAVLHTWGRRIQYHPHLHFIGPAEGLSTDKNEWLPAGNAFYLPVKALSKIFKAKFKAEMAKKGLLHKIDSASWQIDWNVNCQAVGNSEATLKYLAPYIFRVAISDSRIMAVKERTVTFSYRKKGTNRSRKITLDVIEFIRRFLQHVLPAGFMKVRHYGFMSSNCAVPLRRLRLLILTALRDARLCLTDLAAKKPAMPKPFCSVCGGTLLYLFSLIPGRLCRGPT